MKTIKKLYYVHKGLKKGCNYEYKIRAVNGNKKSKFSNTKDEWIPLETTPAPTPTPTTTPTPAPTPTPASEEPKTTWDYYKLLGKIILDNGGLTADGNREITAKYTNSNGVVYTCRIKYDKNYEKFRFSCNAFLQKNDFDQHYSVTMDITETVVNDGTVSISGDFWTAPTDTESVNVFNFVFLEGSGRINMAYYDSSDKPFVMKKTNYEAHDKLLPTIKENLDKMIYDAMMLWSGQIRKYGEPVSMRYLGFLQITSIVHPNKLTIIE